MTIAQENNAATSGQIKQLHRLGEDAYTKALEQFKAMLAELNLDNPGAQRLIEHGNEVVVLLMNTDAVRTALFELSVSDKFKDEEVESNYGYPLSYKPKTVSTQLARLRELFPSLVISIDDKTDLEFPANELPSNAEAYFAIPRWQKLGATYQVALEKVLAALGKQRKFYNYREGALSSDHLQLNQRTIAAFEKLGARQHKHDVLIVPAQFGLRHRGCSVRRAREVFQVNEFGLDPFTVAIMLLTHPEREVEWEQLHIDCAGAEYAPGADGGFSHSLRFLWLDGRLEFLYDLTSTVSDRFGSASGFLNR